MIRPGEVCLARRVPLLLVSLILGAAALSAQPPANDEIDELIVLLAAREETPRPDEVVSAVNAGPGIPVPGGMGEGNPVAARLAIPRPLRGRTREWARSHPASPLALSRRYVVLRYANANLDAIETALKRNKHVLNVEKNYRMYLSLAGSSGPLGDPLVGSPGDPVETSQWGLHLLRVPEVWQRCTSGRAALGFIDTGAEVAHPSLRAFHEDAGGNLVFDNGPLRTHRSRDHRFDNCSVDELDPDDGVERNLVGHGTYTAGIAAAASDGIGTSGICRNCGLLLSKVRSQGDNDQGATFDRTGRALQFLIENGAQVINMSLGFRDNSALIDCGNPFNFLCNQLELAKEREVVVVAAAGNDESTPDFPATDERAIGVGGVQLDSSSALGFSLWKEPENSCLSECGSNFGAGIDVVAPARVVLSTVYTGFDWSPNSMCGDTYPPRQGVPGHGSCRGTSASAPAVTGLLGLMLTVNPWLTFAEARDILITTSSHAANWDSQLAYGVPSAPAAVDKALGTAGGQVLANRLVPLFSLFSAEAGTHVYVTSPTVASSFWFDPNEAFSPVGPAVPGFDRFPGVSPCSVSPCEPPPGASVYVFSTDAPPYPGAPPLVPLHRLIYDPNIPALCDDPFAERIPNRDFAYTTTAEGVLHFKTNVVDSQGISYEPDGVEGYLFQKCEPEPECIPAGAVRLFRLFHPGRDDFAIFPESELAQMQAQGYVSLGGQLSDVLGYVYPNSDIDGDGLIDAFEYRIGTDPLVADTDCDGVSDGDELLRYDMTDPDPAKRGFGDPLVGPCSPIFRDGFETGDVSRWSGTS